MPALTCILETSLYVTDLTVACAFYQDVMGLSLVTRDDRLGSFDVGGRSLLLLFTRGGTIDGAQADGGNDIPPHDGSGQQHMAFSVEKDALEDWDRHLANAGVAILSRTEWKRGGRSLYFRDPDGHLIELAGTPGTWPGH